MLSAISWPIRNPPLKRAPTGIHTYQTAEQVMVVASAENHVAHMADDYLLGHAGGTVEHDVLGAPAIDVLQLAQERNHRRDAGDATHGVDLERFGARLEALVDLLQSQEACRNRCSGLNFNISNIEIGDK